MKSYKKTHFPVFAKYSAGHAWSWNFFFANFQILGPLGCQGWVVIPQNVQKSQNHCTLMRSKAHTALTAPLVLHHTRIYKRAMKKIIFNGQRRNKLFWLIYHSSLVKGAMNATRLCKLCNGVKKTPQFLLFSMAKGGPSAQWKFSAAI